MKRTVALVLLATVLAVLTTGPLHAQPAPRASIQLVSPESGGNVNDPAVSFVWDYIPDAVIFKTTVKNASGSQSVTLESTDAGCAMLRCSVVLDAAEEGWLWKEGATYSWRVKAKNLSGENIGKSALGTFTVDMLENIEIIEPDEGDVAEIITVSPTVEGIQVEWSGISAYAYYVLKLYKKDGSIASTLSVPNVHCGSFCAFVLPVEGMPVGEYKTFYLKVTGTRQYVSGKMKSPKIKIKVFKPA